MDCFNFVKNRKMCSCSHYNFLNLNLLLIAVVTIINSSGSYVVLAQEVEPKYIVAITEYSDTIPLSNSTNRCYATLVTDRHVVTTADCVQTSGSVKLAVSVEISDRFGYGRSQGESTK